VCISEIVCVCVRESDCVCGCVMCDCVRVIPCAPFNVLLMQGDFFQCGDFHVVVFRALAEKLKGD